MHVKQNEFTPVWNNVFFFIIDLCLEGVVIKANRNSSKLFSFIKWRKHSGVHVQSPLFIPILDIATRLVITTI